MNIQLLEQTLTKAVSEVHHVKVVLPPNKRFQEVIGTVGTFDGRFLTLERCPQTKDFWGSSNSFTVSYNRIKDIQIFESKDWDLNAETGIE